MSDRCTGTGCLGCAAARQQAVNAQMNQRKPERPQKRSEATKCDMCGSTAIDHTEMHCQINRLGRLTALTTKEPQS